jgi:hypothetical protein
VGSEEKDHDGSDTVRTGGNMNKVEKTRLRKKALWVAEALGIVLAYFGAFGLLMYPVMDAAGYLA